MYRFLLFRFCENIFARLFLYMCIQSPSSVTTETICCSLYVSIIIIYKSIEQQEYSILASMHFSQDWFEQPAFLAKENTFFGSLSIKCKAKTEK